MKNLLFVLFVLPLPLIVSSDVFIEGLNYMLGGENFLTRGPFLRNLVISIPFMLSTFMIAYGIRKRLFFISNLGAFMPIICFSFWWFPEIGLTIFMEALFFFALGISLTWVVTYLTTFDRIRQRDNHLIALVFGCLILRAFDIIRADVFSWIIFGSVLSYCLEKGLSWLAARRRKGIYNLDIF